MKVIINGFMGGLGRAIQHMAEANGVEIAAGIDIRVQKDTVARDTEHRVLTADNKNGFPVYSNIKSCNVQADVIIECSTAASVSEVIDYAVKKRLPLVICTTGLTDADDEIIEHGAEVIPIFRSSNMSLGVSLVKSLLKSISQIAYDYGFDIEIVEKHHNKKLDAPSGTALMLAEAVNAASGGRYEYVFNRAGLGHGRHANELGIHSVRGGTVFGEHSIIFAGRDEVIEISHTALSRDIFGLGAIKAAGFLSEKINSKPGIYGMDDVIGKHAV